MNITSADSGNSIGRVQHVFNFNYFSCLFIKSLSAGIVLGYN